MGHQGLPEARTVRPPKRGRGPRAGGRARRQPESAARRRRRTPPWRAERRHASATVRAIDSMTRSLARHPLMFEGDEEGLRRTRRRQEYGRRSVGLPRRSVAKAGCLKIESARLVGWAKARNAPCPPKDHLDSRCSRWASLPPSRSRASADESLSPPYKVTGEG